MSFERLPPAIDLSIGPSRALAATGAAAYGTAIAAVLMSGLAWPIRLALILILAGFSMGWIAARALGLAPGSIVRFVWRSDGECEWQEKSGRWRSGILAPGALALPALVIVRFRRGRRRSTLCIARDSVDADALRRLRLRLGISPPPSPPSLTRRLAAGLSRSWKKTRMRGRFATGQRREGDG